MRSVDHFSNLLPPALYRIGDLLCDFLEFGNGVIGIRVIYSPFLFLFSVALLRTRGVYRKMGASFFSTFWRGWGPGYRVFSFMRRVISRYGDVLRMYYVFVPSVWLLEGCSVSRGVGFPSGILLVSTTFLGLIIASLGGCFRGALVHRLRRVSLSRLMACVMLSTNVTMNSGRVRVLVMCSGSSTRLSGYQPSSLSTRLGKITFGDRFKRFSFTDMPYRRVMSHRRLCLSLLDVILSSTSIRQLVLISFGRRCNSGMVRQLGNIGGGRAVRFHVGRPRRDVRKCR